MEIVVNIYDIINKVESGEYSAYLDDINEYNHYIGIYKEDNAHSDGESLLYTCLIDNDDIHELKAQEEFIHIEIAVRDFTSKFLEILYKVKDKDGKDVDFTFDI